MPKDTSSKQARPGGQEPGTPSDSILSRGPCVLAALAALAGAWIAAGSTGMMGHALRHGLTWLALGTAVVAAGRSPRYRWQQAVMVVLAFVAAVAMTASLVVPINILAVALVAAVVSIGRPEGERRMLTAMSAAITILAVCRLAIQSLAPVWFCADALAGWLGRLAGVLVGQPLSVGPTFAGLDYLMLMTALVVMWAMAGPGLRIARLVGGLGMVLAVHIAWLCLMASAMRLLEWLPETTPPEVPFGQLPPWSYVEALRMAIPWNLPAVAAVLHLLLAGLILRAWSLPGTATANASHPPGLAPRATLFAAAVALAAAVPALSTWHPGKGSLEGRKIVAYEKGYLNWLRPQHGDYGGLSIGMYGMLPEFVRGFGGEFLISPDLSEADLRDADGLILLYPDDPWTDGQLERIWKFVQDGGSLLVMGEHTVHEEDGEARFNEVLAPTRMRVPFDSATFAIGGWLQSYDTWSHTTTAGIADDRNQLGVVIGASVEAAWPARPLIIGRWGWNDPGDVDKPPSFMGNHHYDPGERLGDIVLAAEQRLGDGKIIVFGDTSSLTNGIMIGDHPFASRLLAYLASGMQPPTSRGQTIGGVLAVILFIVVLAWHPKAGRTIVAVALMAGSLIACTTVNERACEVLPDGRRMTPNNLAYIDTSHLEASSSESWREDGTMGLAMTLMRSGYLTLDLPEITPQRLEQAGFLISIAPARSFSRAEREAMREFVEGGGIFVCTVGYEEPRRQGAIDLLEEFGFHLGESVSEAKAGTAEPEPLGHFKSPYFNPGDYVVYVRFHATWPVVCDVPADEQRPMAYGRRDCNVILRRKLGKGQIVVVGDTCFAMNKNLEREGGQPFEGMRENADFWRWFLTYITDQPMWVPPNPNPPASATQTASATEVGAGWEQKP